MFKKLVVLTFGSRDRTHSVADYIQLPIRRHDLNLSRTAIDQLSKCLRS